MKTVDYINILIKEKENLTALCKSHAETIRLLKRELGKLNDTILKKDKKIQKLENEISNINPQIDSNELDILKEKYADLQSMYNEVVQKNVSNSKTNKNKNELNKLKSEYNALKKKYDDVVHKNEEFMRIFDEIENTVDSN